MITSNNTIIYRLLGCVIVAVALLTTCDKLKTEDDVLPPLVLSKESRGVFESGISFPSESPQAVTIQFTASHKWSTNITDTKASSWLSVDPSYGEPGDVTMTISALANEGENARSALFAIQCDTLKRSFTVTQAGPPVVHVTEVVMEPRELTLVEGESRELKATVLPQNAKDKTLTWSTSDESVATVTEGVVTAVKEGSAVITALAEGKSATCNVTVSKKVIPVESVILDRTSVTLVEGSAITLVATVLPEDATDKTVTWDSSDHSTVTVTDGEVSALKDGMAYIIAKAGNKTASCTVTVQKKVVDVTSVSLNKTTLALKKGESETLVATVLPEDATDKTVTWTSSDASVASVDQTGKVTATGGGSATITANAGEKMAKCTVTVTVPVESVTLDVTSVTLEEWQTILITATVSPADATNKTVNWSSSNTGVASVVGGLITAKSEGVAVITAKAGDKTATCNVTVKKTVIAVTSVTLNKAEIMLNKGDSETLVATVYPNNATDKTVSWSSSDPAVVSVDQTGKVTASGAGTANITARAGDQSAVCQVTVVIPITGLELYDDNPGIVNVGESVIWRVKVIPEDATETPVWSVFSGYGDPSCVSVDCNGKITGLKEGTSIVQVGSPSGNPRVGRSINVLPQVVHVTSVTLNKYTVELSVGQTEQLTATVLPENATDKNVIWQSLDESIATVEDGLITAVSEGEARITASCDGVTSSYCWVIVQKKEIQVESVSLDRSYVMIEEGQSVFITATVYPSNATYNSVIWRSSDDSVVTVINGYVTAIKEGTALITASAGGKSAYCGITVTKRTVAVEGITLNKYSLNLKKGESETLVATVFPEDASDKTVTWSSSDSSVASVDQTGKITALSEGYAFITAKAGDKEAYCDITVTKKTVAVEGIILNKYSLKLEEGEAETLFATVIPADATNNTVTWISSDETVATVTDGHVIALNEGTADITATAEYHSATCKVMVSKAIVVGETDWKKLPFYHNSLYIKFTSVYCGFSDMMERSLELVDTHYYGKYHRMTVMGPMGELDRILCVEGVDRLMERYIIQDYPLGVLDGRRFINNWGYKEEVLRLFSQYHSEQLNNYPPVTGTSFSSVRSNNNLTVSGTVYSHLAGEYLLSVFLVEDRLSVMDYYQWKDDEEVNVLRLAVSNILGDSIIISQDNSTKDFNYKVQIPDDCKDNDLSILVLVQRKYGNQPILSSSYFGDYYFDNCAKGKVGEHIPLRMDNYVSDSGNEGITVGDEITF